MNNVLLHCRIIDEKKNLTTIDQTCYQLHNDITNQLIKNKLLEI